MPDTREYEKESICDSCLLSPEACGLTELKCLDMLKETIADDMIKAAKEDP